MNLLLAEVKPTGAAAEEASSGAEHRAENRDKQISLCMPLSGLSFHSS